ncbi:hypothetical protein CBM2586_B130512 [Cupriavidus phytorum]|uniref:Uncharacterized protein n=1 Tax=Cupriavidus taiwanensis TaxID=164546 RepID=A0A976AAH5_9BURK|nr:hypothetical protein CBM2586_B130512 [Cupriavidus taiwanensis]
MRVKEQVARIVGSKKHACSGRERLNEAIARGQQLPQFWLWLRFPPGHFKMGWMGARTCSPFVGLSMRLHPRYSSFGPAYFRRTLQR